MINWYQSACKRTLKGDYSHISEKDIATLNLSACICEEAGEIYGALKKQIVHEHGLDQQKVAKEIGDCMWYIANLCNILDIDLEDVMIDNIEKLKSRYPDGFSTINSIKRMDEEIG